MAKKCPPGVICIESMTLFIIFILLLLVIILAYTQIGKFQRRKDNKVDYVVNINENERGNSNGLFARPAYTFSNIRDDVLLNPYEAPLRDNRVFQNNDQRGGVPINIKTQSFNTNYRQIGILTRHGGTKETILPIMGRPLITNRDKWNFYTMSEGNNLLKLPISYKGRNCTSENGCDDLYTGDVVKVDGYNDSFKVTTYENNSPQYIPYI